jgi:hypothetical protein
MKKFRLLSSIFLLSFVYIVFNSSSGGEERLRQTMTGRMLPVQPAIAEIAIQVVVLEQLQLLYSFLLREVLHRLVLIQRVLLMI